ncbi:hypothetical protein BDFB_013003 [Asbolus verrucosus]|uniref:Uncharacterized protein n=1 Tax=Asbolus verrucosus TaxID=1661398 RepID=A0A482VD81_ASBVE|nr:hypothetical protein BDFB_013003 [Asbolus verrucosus]
MERFPNRRIPNFLTFVRAVQHHRDHGCFKTAAYDRGKQRPDRVENIEEAVLNSVEARPGSNTRRLTLQHEVSHTTIWRILKEQQLYSYHVRKGYMKDLVYSTPIETIEILQERVKNAATAIRNNRITTESV